MFRVGTGSNEFGAITGIKTRVRHEAVGCAILYALITVRNTVIDTQAT